MSGEKTEAPTPKRKREARKKGQIPKSPEITMWAQVLVASLVLKLTMSKGASEMSSLLGRLGEAISGADMSVALGLFGDAAMGGAMIVAPLAAAMCVIGVLGNVGQTGLVLSGDSIKPKVERINPWKGAKRTFSPQGAWQAGKVLLKSAVLVAVAWPPLSHTTQAVIAAGRPDVGGVLVDVGGSALAMVRNVALAGLVLGAVDYGISRRKVMKGMRMSKHEIKQESRQSEGDPMLKGEIRSRQLSMSRNRMMTAVADAAVVIVNPTHVAVALKYDRATGAPTVVAKGKGAIALKIRERAEAAGVPIVRDVPLARTLESACQLGQEIPGELYEAVARLLAFVFTLSRTPGLTAGVLTSPG